MFTEQKEHTAHCANSIVLFFGRSIGNTSVYGQTKASSDDYEHELTSKFNGWKSRMKMAHTNEKQQKKKNKKSTMTMMTALTISDDKPIENVPHWTNENPILFFLSFSRLQFLFFSQTFYSAHK